MNLRWNIISIVAYTATWLAMGAIIYFGILYAMRLNWFGAFMLIPFILWLGSLFDKVHAAVDIASLSKTAPSQFPLYWAWLPTFTIGIVVLLMPVRFGYVGYSLYGSSLMGIKEWFIVAELTLLPVLNFYSIIRTPYSVKQNMLM